MKPAVLTFLFRLSLFLMLIVIVDLGLGYLLRTAYFSQKKGQFAQTTYSIDSTNHEVLIFGSSRAIRHYSPSILSNGLKMSCYNVGRDAQMIPYYAAMQEAIFTRYKPKVIILDINSWELSPGSGKYEKLSILLPYGRKHPELLKYLNESSEWENIKLLSSTYPYNSTLFILGYNLLFENQIPADDHGYMPLIGKMTQRSFNDYMSRIASENENRIDIDLKALNYYESFLANTEKNNIKTYVVISPQILSEQNRFKSNKLVEIATRYKNVKFIDFSNDKKYNFKYEKFVDVFHLNKQGAEEFSRDLIRYLN